MRRRVWHLAEPRSAQTPTHLVVANAGHVLGRGCADNIEDEVELVQIMLAGKEGAIADHLRQNATHRPFLNRKKGG